MMGKGHQGRGNSMNKWMKARKHRGVGRKSELLGLIMMGKGRLGLDCDGQPRCPLPLVPCFKDKAEGGTNAYVCLVF